MILNIFIDNWNVWSESYLQLLLFDLVNVSLWSLFWYWRVKAMAGKQRKMSGSKFTGDYCRFNLIICAKFCIGYYSDKVSGYFW